jgi:hypothetical protein
VSTDDRIAMLEALLARVKSRDRTNANGGASAGTNGTKPHADDEAVLSPLPASPLDVPTPMGAFRPSSVPPPPAGFTPDPPRYTSRPEAPALFSAKPVAPSTRAPSDASLDQTLVEAATSSRRIAPRAEPSGVRAVEPPPMEVIELDVDPDPSLPPPSVSPMSVSPVSGASRSEEGLESRSRLVSAPPLALDALDPLDAIDGDDDDLMDDDEDEDEEPFALSAPGHAASDPTIEAAPAEVSEAEMDAIEAADRAPSSSRRPISMEDKMSELEDDAPPLHTPPPASGKLPAASAAIDLEPLDSQPMLVAAPALASVPAPKITRESVRAEPLAPMEVAVFVGRAPSDLASKTFGDLLDATLAL